jgi:hypothetical protein
VSTIVGGEVRYDRDVFEWLELRRNAATARQRMFAAGPLSVRP